MDFLNNIDLKKNELRNAAIQNLTSDPSDPVDGQVYYNSTDKTIYVWTGAGVGNGWKSIQGDITAVDSGTTEQLTVATGTGPVPTLSIKLASAGIADGDNGLTTSQQVFDYVDSLSSGVVSVTTGDSDTITIAGTTSQPTVAANTGPIANGGVRLATADQIHTFVTDFGYSTTEGTVTSVSAGDGISITGDGTVTPTVALRYSTATNYIKARTPASSTGIVGTDLLPFSNASDNVLSIPLEEVPMAALSLVKNYVDTAVAGGGTFQGGYNATTNDPNLDGATPIAGIAQGMQWAVTHDGDFFTEQVRVGDLLIANSDDPTALSDWTTVQSNIDLATTTVAGIASFSSSNFAVSAAGAVTVKNDGIILGTETAGDYVRSVAAGTGLLRTQATTEGAAATINIDLGALATGTSTHLVMTEAASGADSVLTTVAEVSEILNADVTYAATITADATVTHSLGTKDVIVQLYDVTTFDTVYADIDRASINAIGVSFGTNPANSIRVLIQKIG